MKPRGNQFGKTSEGAETKRPLRPVFGGFHVTKIWLSAQKNTNNNKKKILKKSQNVFIPFNRGCSRQKATGWEAKTAATICVTRQQLCPNRGNSKDNYRPPTVLHFKQPQYTSRILMYICCLLFYYLFIFFPPASKKIIGTIQQKWKI